MALQVMNVGTTTRSVAQLSVPRVGGVPLRVAAPSKLALKASMRSPLMIKPTLSSNRVSRVVVTAAASATAPSPASAGPTLASIAAAATNLFPVFVLGAALLGLAQPTSFDWFLPSYMTPALGVTMLGMGLTLTLKDFKRVLTTPGRILLGFALQYTIMPLLAFTISRAVGLPLDFAIGLCLVGSCPGGTASNVVTYLARADTALSVAMTTASTMGAVIATPFLSKLLLGTLVPVDAMALFVSTLQVVLFPVLGGAALNQAFPKQVSGLAPLSALSAVLLIAAICGSVIATNASAVLSAGPKLLAAVASLHAGGFFFGYTISKVLGVPEIAARTNSIEVGMQNSALGALLASRHFAANPLAAVPCAISACTHSVMGSLLAAFWRSRSTDDAGAGASGIVRAAVAAVPELDATARRQQVRKWIAEWRLRTGAPGGPSKWVTPDEVAQYSAEQLAFLERKRKEAAGN